MEVLKKQNREVPSELAIICLGKDTEQPRCRRTDEQIRKIGYIDMKQRPSAIKKQSTMLWPALEKKVEMTILTEVRDTGRHISIYYL